MDNKYMNSRGFTLVELLAVLVILISVSLVAVGGISESLNRRDEKEKNEQIELAKGAAKIYFSLNNKTCVTIETLIDEDYFSDDSKVSELDDTYTVRLVTVGTTYYYSYSSTSCG